LTVAFLRACQRPRHSGRACHRYPHHGDPINSNNGFFYLHGDHLGSTSLLTYGNGHAQAGDKVNGTEVRYLPFGGRRLTPTTELTERDFTGQKENLELGLLYYNARYYVPGIGRFLTADTIVPNAGNPQAYNRYSYVYNVSSQYFGANEA
jgi:RHS repeat-associated protein